MNLLCCTATLTLSLCFVPGPACLAAPPSIIHVSPGGDDRASGTAARPFATLERARQQVRTELAKPGATGPIRVELAAGAYHLRRTLLLSPQDSGTAQRPVTWAAGANASVVISAGLPIRAWRRLAQPLPGAPAASQGALWSAPLPDGLQTFRALFDSAGLLTRATYGPITARAVAESRTQFTVDPAGLRSWADPTAIEVAMAPTVPFAWNVLGVAAINLQTGTVTTTAPGTLPLSGAVFLENVPEGLNGPGTWWLDTAQKRVVLWPRRQTLPGGIVAPVLIEAVRLQGTPSSPVRFVSFSGLTFSHGDRALKTPETVTIIPIHDWEYHDQDNSLLRLRDTSDIRVEDCVFTHSAGSGIRMDHGARNNTVDHSLFTELGGIGISLVGNLPGQGDVHGHHDLGFNLVHHTGLIFRTSPAIFLYQSNHTRIHDNRIHDLPYAGIVLFGNRNVFLKPTGQPVSELLYGGDNTIEHNDLSRLIQKLGDGSGIYISATPPGNVVRRNHIHDVEHQINGGVRTDDQQSKVLVEENLIHDLTGMGIILKHVNHARHNIVVDCTALISVRHWGPNVGSTIHGNILVHRKAQGDNSKLGGAYAPFFTEYKPVKLNDYDVANNVFFSPADPGLAQRAFAAVTALGKQPGIVADPLFVDPGRHDFRLQPASPALKLGFPAIGHWGPRGPVGPRRP